MGWMSFQMNQPVKKWFKSIWDDNDVTVLDIAVVKRNTLYAAIRNEKTSQVFCAVYLLRWSRERGYNFSYKPMTEFVGPGESECPKRILNLLSPLNDENDSNGWAKEWRKRCWDNIHNREKMCTGNYVLKTKEPVKFTSGNEFQYFKKIGRRMYAGVIENNQFRSFGRVRLNIKYQQYEMIVCN
jgi:hypothetical protein